MRRRSLVAASGARAAIALLLIVAAAGCGRDGVSAGALEPAALRVGYGLTSGTSADVGIRQAARLISLEGLVVVGTDGRPLPRLAESWSVSSDGLTWRIRLRQAAKFHTGQRLDAAIVKQILDAQLARAMGPAVDDVADVRVASERDLDVRLTRPSAFLMELLDQVTIQLPAEPFPGAGPFRVSSERADQIEMTRNEAHYAGLPTVPAIIIKPYTSLRASWADLLRGQVDMLYDVGVEALDSLESSNDVRVYSFQRGYAYLLLLNLKKPHLKDAAFRRGLNDAIDRDSLIRDSLRGHGTPARGPVSPKNWAYSADLPQFRYQPRSMDRGSAAPRVRVIFEEPSLERLALVVQRQLQAVGIELDLERIAAGSLPARLRAGDFDAALADYRQGPNLSRPYLYWHTGAPLNFGGYSNTHVDVALDGIRHAANDTAYKAGVTAFQRAIVDDPPAVFLAWSERARAVSTRFQVPTDVDGDILRTIHRWRPTGRDLLARSD